MAAAALLKWMWLFFLLTVRHASSEPFSLTGPDTPVSGLLGASVSLLCSLSNNLDATQFEVRWYRPSMYGKPVLWYKNKQLVESPVDEQYQDRVSLVGALEKGDVSLKLDQIKLKDEGIYICRVSSDSWYDTKNVSLKTQAEGSVPILSIEDAGGGRVNVSCHSDGWKPNPSVNWSDRDGNLKHNSNDKFIKGSEELVSVSSWVLVSPSESNWVSCSVGFSERKERKESRIIPYTSKESWKGAFIAALIILLLLIIGLALYFVLHRKGLLGSKRKTRENPEESAPLNLTEEKQNEALAVDPRLPSEHREVNNQNPGLRMNSAAAETESLSWSLVMEDQQKQKKPSEEQNVHKENSDQPSAASVALNSSPVKKDQQTQRTAQSEQNSNMTDAEAVTEHNHHTVHQQQTSADASENTSAFLTKNSPDTDLHTTGAGAPNSAPAKKDQQTQRTSQPDQIPSNMTDPEAVTDHNPHTVQQPLTSAEWLKQMRQFTENITIDPEETPDFFRLAQKGKRVTCTLLKQTDEEEECKIFTLCKQQFSSGKHYWEVKVCQKPKEKLSWFVGVASESAERVNRIPFTPQNEFWVLCYEAEREVYVRAAATPTPLPFVSDTLTTVGVFLDCDEHTLSFYNVNAKSLIFTFTAVTHRSPLRPLFSPGIRDNKPVHIC